MARDGDKHRSCSPAARRVGWFFRTPLECAAANAANHIFHEAQIDFPPGSDGAKPCRK